MTLLLDTHAFLWFLDRDPSLSRDARDAIEDSSQDVFVSAASAWEITTKHRIGKLPGAATVAADVQKVILEKGFTRLAISVAHAQHAGSLPGQHRDPFDRMLAAQALLDGLVVVTNDRDLASFGVRTLW